MFGRRLSLVCVALAAGALAACGDDDGGGVRNLGSGSASGSGSGVASECEPVGDISTADVEVDVELSEWLITAPPEAEGGAVGVVAKNIGAEPHEVVVIQLDSAADLPLDEIGALDESALPEGALIGEIEPFPAGDTCTGVFELAAGPYVLVCNIVETEEDGTVESHLALGMVTELTITP
jgi:hypothetical protein